LQSIQTLLDVRSAHPSVDARKTMEMIGEILFPKEDIDTGDGVPVQVVASNGKMKKYDSRFDLIGQMASKNTKAIEKYVNNPWGVKVGTYQKCERCGKVGIAFITTDTHPGAKDPVTRLYKRMTHEDNETHNIALWKTDGTHSYESLVKLWGKNNH